MSVEDKLEITIASCSTQTKEHLIPKIKVVACSSPKLGAFQVCRITLLNPLHFKLWPIIGLILLAIQW